MKQMLEPQNLDNEEMVLNHDGEGFVMLESEESTLDALIAETESIVGVLEDLTPEEKELMEQISSLSADGQLYMFGALMSVGMGMCSIWIALDDLAKGKLDTNEAIWASVFVLISLFVFYKLNRANENRRFKLTQLVDNADVNSVRKVWFGNEGDLLSPEQLERMKEKFEQGKIEELES